jgi:uncharacterized protein (TIGR02453 family)
MKTTLHPDTLPFLQELTVNNNRPWFNDHKDRWLAIKADFEVFTQALIDEMVKYDDTLVGLTAKNSVYRIYRDTRFSADKTPYKTHIACFLSSWGPKNSGVPGYYFQIGTEEAYGLKGTCNLGGGIFMPTPEALNAIRQEIFYCTDEFKAILNAPDYKRYYGKGFFTTKKLSRPPKGYSADWPDIDLLKYCDYCSMHEIPRKTVLSDGFFEEVVRVWKATVPLNRFIERALTN